MLYVYVIAWVLAVVGQVVSAVWLIARAKGRAVLVCQAQLLAVLAPFMVVSGAMRFPLSTDVQAGLSVLYVLTGTLICVLFVRVVLAWAMSDWTPRRWLSPYVIPALGTAVLIGVMALWGPSASLVGLPWYIVWVSFQAVPAAVALFVFGWRRWSEMDAADVRREGPWLIASGLVLVKGVAWILGEDNLLGHMAILVDSTLMVFWARSAERAAAFHLTVDNVGVSALRDLQEGLVLVGVSGRVDVSNARADQLVGAPVVGRSFGDLCPGWPEAGSTTLRTVHGDDIPVVVGIAPLFIEGDVVGHAVTITDVSPLQRALDEAKDAREAAIAAAGARQDFLAVMSHEIRTPMNAVVGLAHLLDESELNPDQKQWAATIRQSADALLVMLSDILDFSRIESGRMTVERVGMSPAEVLSGAVDVVRSAAERTHVVLAVDLVDLPPRVLSDPTRIRQIVLNLLSNAVKFTPKGEIRLAAHFTDGRLEVTVSDTGIGIPADRMDSLFEAFTQVDTSTTRRFGGTGLGLAISERLATALGGRLTATSEVGVGTTFSLSIPVEAIASAPRPDSVQVSDVADLARLRVLVVEDNPVNRMVFRAILQQWGIVPEEADNGQVGVERVVAETFDAVVMDIQMPVMDGYDAMRAIVSKLGDRRPFLVSHSANVGREDYERAKACGADAHLPKPATPAAIRAVLVAAANHHRAPVDMCV